ncbi:MAG: carboxymuconolactone decarboxylase family protein, partial [Acidimicrobiales bacterium]
MTTPARIPLLSVEDARAAAATAGVPELVADLSVFRLWLHHPRLARWLSDLIMGMLGEGRLDARLRELAIMRVGWVTHADYEWTQHWRIALGLGVPEDDLLGVRRWPDYEGFGPAERAVLAAVDETLAEGTIGALGWA